MQQGVCRCVCTCVYVESQLSCPEEKEKYVFLILDKLSLNGVLRFLHNAMCALVCLVTHFTLSQSLVELMLGPETLLSFGLYETVIMQKRSLTS